MKNKVSIIIPIYNAEKYLEKCVDSVIDQKLKEIEIILVNDGSTDKSKDICDLYKNKDKRIKTINKENGGPSETRNIGLENCTGEYIGFLDADDWIEKDMLWDMYKVASQNNLDLVVSGQIIDFENEKYQLVKNIQEKIIIDDNEKLENTIFELCNNDMFHVVWNKLYKRELVKDKKFVIDGMPAEDVIFNVDVFLKIQSLGIINQAYYHYIKVDSASYVTRYVPDMYKIFEMRNESFEKLFDTLGLNKNEHKQWLDKAYINGLSDCIINLYRNGSNMTFKEKKGFVKNHIVNNKELTIIMNQEINNMNIVEKIFYLCCKINIPEITVIIYEILFILKNKFFNVYKIIRKKYMNSNTQQ